jgi:GTP diphosphokinase / guanosine-3',5'-bis(diphosphate) 3'-diphosphatase
MPARGNPLVPFGRDRDVQRLDARFEELLAKLKKNRPGEGTEAVQRAYELASEQHRGQVRQSGEPYLTHPLEVAHILADMKLDATTVCAALLHDIVEDTRVSHEQIAEKFGPETARLVEGVTKISRLDLLAPEARQAESLRKMLLAMVGDVRVVVVKLADRLHNMRTLDYLPPDKRVRISRETMDLYAPIAHRLGMGLVRAELEDLAFRHLESDAHLTLQREVASHSLEYQKFLEEVQETIRKKLVENSIPAEVQGRIKGLYSLHDKITRQQRPLEQVYDLLAVRVITDTERNCYAALGVIHQIWRPVPGRFKDYIAMSRPNLYQSLHTTVIHRGQPFELQIRTQEMHRIAEEGVAAHWKYKDGKQVSEADDRRIAWMRQLIEWAQEMQEPGEFLSTLKVDLYPLEVYAFTPKGRVLELPRGATPVDFAYAIHSEVGHQCVGAKANGQIVPLRYEIANGDVVEILTQKGHTPSRDWLTYVKTSRARSKIRQWINLHERMEATEMGRRLLEKEARQRGRSLKKIPETELARVAAECGYTKVEDLFASVGFGKFSARQVVSRALGEPATVQAAGSEGAAAGSPKLVTTMKRMLGLTDSPVLVRGQDDLMVFRAKCCNPIPGDEIVGYVTRGRGVAVHNRNCPNVQNLLYESERRINVAWGAPEAAKFPVNLLVKTRDRPGILAEMTGIISAEGCNIETLESRPEGLNARIELRVDISDRQQLEKILTNMKKITGVYGVERVYHA